MSEPQVDGGVLDSALAADAIYGGPTYGDSGECPPTPQETFACTGTATCAYSQMTCTCASGFWHCVDARCPAQGQAPPSCSESFACDYGFEDSCSCTSGQWLCCGGIAQCPFGVPVDGSPCCKGGGWECGYGCNGLLCSSPNSPQTCTPEATLCTCGPTDLVWHCAPANFCAPDAAAD